MSDDKLNDLSEFLQDQMNRMFALQVDMVELEAIWIGGKLRVADGDMIFIDEYGKISKDGDYATHKCIGCYGTIGSSRHELIVTDVITNEIQIINRNNV